MAAAADAGLVASPGPRYFGFVTGGAMPVTVAADWLASAWDQNGALYVMSPAVAVMEDIVAGWLVDFLVSRLSRAVGFVTGAHMANFTCLAAARHEVLRRAGWNVEDDGLQRAPKLTVIVGDEVHVSVVGALRMLGVGARELVRVPVDGQGRLRQRRVRAHARESRAARRSSASQAGNVSTGASDPFMPIIGPRTRGAHGSTSTARSACGPRPCQSSHTASTVCGRPIRGRPTRTSGSTCPTIPGWPSSHTPRRIARR